MSRPTSRTSASTRSSGRTIGCRPCRAARRSRWSWRPHCGTSPTSSSSTSPPTTSIASRSGPWRGPSRPSTGAASSSRTTTSSAPSSAPRRGSWTPDTSRRRATPSGCSSRTQIDDQQQLTEVTDAAGNVSKVKGQKKKLSKKEEKQQVKKIKAKLKNGEELDSDDEEFAIE